MRKISVFLLSVCSFLLYAQQVTPNMGLILPPNGYANWGAIVNQNFNKIDTMYPNLTLAQTWNSSAVYSKGQVVLYNSVTYASLVNNNLNNNPSTDSLHWQQTSAVFPATGGFVFSTNSLNSRTATPADLATLLASLSGCTTAGFTYSPASGVCINSTGGGVGPGLSLQLPIYPVNGANIQGSNIHTDSTYSDLGARYFSGKVFTMTLFPTITVNGDSISAGYQSIGNNGWPWVVATDLQATLHDNGVGGSWTNDQAAVVYTTNVPAQPNWLAIQDGGTNEVQQGYSVNPQAGYIANFQNEMMAENAFKAIPTSTIITGSALGCATGWSAGPYYNGSGTQIQERTSSTAGATCTFSITGSIGYLAYTMTNSNSMTGSVSCDSGAYGPYTFAFTGSGGISLTSPHGTTYGPGLLRWTGMSSGTHSCTLTTAGSGTAYIDWATGLPGTANSAWPTEFIMETPPLGTSVTSPPSPGCSGDTSGPLETNTILFAQAGDTVASTLAGDGLNVHIVNTRCWQASQYYYETPPVHPTDWGSQFYAQAIELAIRNTTGAPSFTKVPNVRATPVYNQSQSGGDNLIWGIGAVAQGKNLLQTTQHVTAIGAGSLANLVNGNDIVALGFNACLDLAGTSGVAVYGNFCFGKGANAYNVSNSGIISIGEDSNEAETTGFHELAIGHMANRFNSIGNSVTGVGFGANQLATSGVFLASSSPINYISGGTFSGTGTCSATAANNFNSLLGAAPTGTVNVVNGAVSGALIPLTEGQTLTAVPTLWTLASGTATCSGQITTSGGNMAYASSLTSFGTLAAGGLLFGNNIDSFGISTNYWDYTGNRDEAFGDYTLQSNYYGNDLTAMGDHALTSTTTTNGSTAIGSGALQNSTTVVGGTVTYASGGTVSGTGTCTATSIVSVANGYAPSLLGTSAVGTFNATSGVISGNLTFTSHGSMLIGVPTQWTLSNGTATCSGTATTTGGSLVNAQHETAVGFNACNGNTYASDSNCIGYSAGMGNGSTTYGNTTGTHNSFIGPFTGFATNSQFNYCIDLGWGASCDSSNELMVGDANVTHGKLGNGNILATFTGTPTANHVATFTGNTTGPMLQDGGVLTTTLPASITTTAATSDNVTITGMAATGHCSLAATNTTAATNIATTYISNKTTNQITVTHAAVAGMSYDILCTVN